MTIENMTIMSYALLAVAVMLGIVAVVLFFTLKIPKAYRSVKGQGKNRKRKKKCKEPKRVVETVQLEQYSQPQDNGVHFTVLQDITYIHTKEV